MPFKDLREFIHVLQQRGELKTIDGANTELEIGGVSQIAAESPRCPALLFDSIAGYARGQRVVTNIIASKARERLIYGISEELSDKEALLALKEKLKQSQPIAPLNVSQAPIRQNCLTGSQIDLAKLPWLRWHEGERDRCHHDAVIITRYPSSDHIDITAADLALIDRDASGDGRASANCAVVRHKHWTRSKACPVAISLGHEPSLLAAVLSDSPNANGGYGFAGWLRGAPIEVIDGEFSGLPIPASAEVVLEGELAPAASGDQASVKPSESTLTVKRVYFRNDPILIGNSPFLGATHGVLASRAASVWNELERMGIGNIVAVNQRPWGVTVLAIKQLADGDVQRVANALLESSAGRILRYAVIVDEDIDPYNLERVFWAIVTRYEAQQALQIVRRLRDAAGDTAASTIAGNALAAPGSAAIIDGCRPFRWMDKFPRTTDISEELMQKTVVKWGKLLERRS
jgi:UbiD family decarboxylase